MSKPPSEIFVCWSDASSVGAGGPGMVTAFVADPGRQHLASVTTYRYKMVVEPKPRRPALAYVVKRYDGQYAYDDHLTMWTPSLACARRNEPTPAYRECLVDLARSVGARVVRIVRKAAK